MDIEEVQGALADFKERLCEKNEGRKPAATQAKPRNRYKGDKEDRELAQLNARNLNLEQWMRKYAPGLGEHSADNTSQRPAKAQHSSTDPHLPPLGEVDF